MCFNISPETLNMRQQIGYCRWFLFTRQCHLILVGTSFGELQWNLKQHTMIFVNVSTRENAFEIVVSEISTRSFGMCHHTRPALVQILACGVPSHYMNKCLLIINWAYFKKIWIWKNTTTFIKQNGVQNTICKMVAIFTWSLLERAVWGVNMHRTGCNVCYVTSVYHRVRGSAKGKWLKIKEPFAITGLIFLYGKPNNSQMSASRSWELV